MLSVGLDCPKAPMPPGVVFERFVELRLAEIRPERGRDDQFGVGNLPQQKITDPHLAARADQHIRVGNIARPQML